MSNWEDLIDAMAARRPEVRVVPPTLKYEDLWDQQQRIEALEAEVTYLNSVLRQILERLDTAEGSKEN